MDVSRLFEKMCAVRRNVTVRYSHGKPISVVVDNQTSMRIALVELLDEAIYLAEGGLDTPPYEGE
jgi:hypothetical protein